MLALALLVAAATAEPLTIEVAPGTREVVVKCGTREDRYTPKGSRVRIEEPAGPCSVSLVLPAGEVSGGGTWRCAPTGCTKAAGSAPVAVPNSVSIALPADDHTTGFELSCPSGYRERVNVEAGKATFHDVPDEECTLLFKGGAPAKFRPVRWGHWSCLIDTSTAVCERG